MNAGLNIMNMFGWNNPASMMGMNPYGCGNSSMLSIFGNGFGCNAEYNAGAYIGMSFAPMVLQCITGAIGSGVRTAKDNSDATLARDKGAVLKDIGGKLNQLVGVKGAENLKPDTITVGSLDVLEPAEKFNTAIAEAGNKINEFEKPKELTDEERKDQKNLDNYNKALQTYYSNIATWEAKKAEAEAALEAEQKRINGIKTELTALIQERDNIQKEINARQAKADEKALRRGDGNKWTRNEELNLDNILTEVTEGCWSLKDNCELNKQDIQQLVYLFHSSLSSGNKNEIRKHALNLTKINMTDFSKNATKSQLQAREIASKWLEAHQ